MELYIEESYHTIHEDSSSRLKNVTRLLLHDLEGLYHAIFSHNVLLNSFFTMITCVKHLR